MKSQTITHLTRRAKHGRINQISGLHTKEASSAFYQLRQRGKRPQAKPIVQGKSRGLQGIREGAADPRRRPGGMGSCSPMSGGTSGGAVPGVQLGSFLTQTTQNRLEHSKSSLQHHCSTPGSCGTRGHTQLDTRIRPGMSLFNVPVSGSHLPMNLSLVGSSNCSSACTQQSGGAPQCSPFWTPLGPSSVHPARLSKIWGKTPS